MKYTLRSLTEVLTFAPRGSIHMQGSNEDAHTIVTCKHPKYDTPLYVAEKGHGRIHPKLTGNPKAALRMTINVAKSVRDNLTEHYNNVELRAA